mgnify:FL=1
MLKNYFKTAWRNLLRNKAFSIINISGLALGLTSSLLIMLWIQDEKAVDGFHKNSRQLYQVYERWYRDGRVDAGYSTQGLLAGELKRVIPEIQYAAGLEIAAAPGASNTFEAGDKVIKQKGYFAGTDFFTMFSYRLLQGNAATALSEPGAIAISGKMAEAFFDSPENAYGKIILFDNKESLKITAVFDDVPANASRQFDFLRTWNDFVQQNQWVNNWGNTDPVSFVQLRAGADPMTTEAKIRDFIYRYQQKSEGSKIEVGLQPYSQVYLHSVFENGYPGGGRIEYVNLFTIIGIFVLLIACINFMNLATAQAAKRAKEVGLRKVVGAQRSSLVKQFMGEAVMLTLIAILIALACVAVLMPAFNALSGKQLSLPVSQPLFWAAIAALVILTGATAGSYPALFLSSLNPVKVLKGPMKTGSRGMLLRQGLVVFQFTLSIILIVAVAVISRQMNYIQTKNLGYDRDNLVYIPIEGELIAHYNTFKERALGLPGVQDISKMRNSPTEIEHHVDDISWPGKDPNAAISFADGVVGYDFVKTMKLQLKAGRDFSPQFGADSTGFLVNEAAVKKMGFDDPVGKTVVWGRQSGTIIGVLKDFHFNSMHQSIEPLIIRLSEKWPWGNILVRVKNGNTRQVLAGLEKLSKEINPQFPFTYQFSDLEFAKLYRSETVVSRLSDCFAFLAIFISCLGLFGLATFTAAQRTKEIGVRKVLGASVPGIVAMFSGSFVRLVVIAMLIAFPVAWFAMHKWLENFAYKINIEWWVFVLAGLITVVIALITVSYQSIKAALSNPVQSLRTE